MTPQQAQEIAATGAAVTAPDGRRCLNTPIFIPFTQQLAIGESRLDLSQTVPAAADFYWRGVWFNSASSNFLLLVRFRLATGYYLSNALMPMDQLNLAADTPELKVPAGNAIGVEVTNNTGAIIKLQVVFFGVQRYYLDA